MTLLDDFLARNGDAADRHSASLIASLPISDQLKLAQILLDSVASTLFGVRTDDIDDEDYECLEDDE